MGSGVFFPKGNFFFLVWWGLRSRPNLHRPCAQKLDIDLKLDLINESNIAQVFRLFDKSN